MGFVFYLIGFPLLLFVTVLLVYFTKTNNKIALKVLSLICVLAILIIVITFIGNRYRTPIRLTAHKIIGEYRIDKNFYPGKNADWQYDHYRFTITKTDSIYFYVTNKDTVLQAFKGKIKYSIGPPDLWIIQIDSSHQIIKHPPTLYRSHKKFYYVFKSDLYGNMFFRKQE